MRIRPRRSTMLGSLAVAIALATVAGVGRSEAQASSPPINRGDPLVFGSFQQGRTLSVLNGAWDGDPFSFSYRWQRCDPIGGLATCTDIGGASAATYRLRAGDVGSLVRVQVAATNTDGPSAVASSAAVGPVVAAGAPSNSSRPVIGGPRPPMIGRALTGAPGLWVDAVSFDWQWLRCGLAGGNCVLVDGATSRTYTPVAADAGSTLRLNVTATSDAQPRGSGRALSAPTRRVVAAGPVNISRPVISGTPRSARR